MKPLLLTMQAFGSYAKKSVVDFSELDSGLYLITGDTGAGKTTIFDAMVYALYGEASGSGRDGSMLHSDYVDKSVDTFVSLEFMHNDKTYKVERKIHFPKSRNSGYGDPKQTAVFYEDGKEPLEVSRKVTARVTEIIGLDANQFKQIIVLAQGEFQKFLKADSAQRNQILGKLFDNSPYVRFQSRLKEAAKVMKNKVDEKSRVVSIKLADFIVPEGMDELLYMRSNPDHVQNMSLLVENENAKCLELDGQIKKIQLKLDEVIAKRAQALDRNMALDVLKEQKMEYESLLSKRVEMDDLEKVLNRVDVAYSRVLPLKSACLKAKGVFDRNEKDLNLAEDQLNSSQKEKDLADRAFECVSGLNEKNVELVSLLKDLNKQLDFFKPYNEKKEVLNHENKKLFRLNQDVCVSKKKQEELNLNKNEMQKRLDEIRLKTDVLASTQIQYDGLRDQYEKLIGSDGLISKLDEITKNEALLNKYKQSELVYMTDLRKKKQIYDDIYDRFLMSQANILSKELKQELQIKDEVLCPVCRSHLTKSDLSRFVEDSDVLVNKDQVDFAESEYKEIESKLNNQHTKSESLAEKIKGLKINVVDFSSQVGLKIHDFDALSNDVVACYREELLNKKQACFGLLENLKRLKSEQLILEENLKKVDLEIETIHKSFEEQVKLRDEVMILVSKLEVELENIKSTLNGLSEDEIRLKIQRTKKESQKIEQDIHVLTENKRLAQKRFSEIRGSLDELMKKKQLFMDDYMHSLDVYNKSLLEFGFQDDEDYESVISLGGDHVDVWIQNTRNRVQLYREKFKSIHDRLMEQSEKCKDYVYTDLNRMESDLKAYRECLEKLSKEQKDTQNLKYNHETILHFIQEKYREIGNDLPIYERLSTLSDLANAGVNMDGGKITFDRYVMGSAFGEILKAANVHLSVMASGRYELIHQTRADGASSHAGLGIDILDVFTGEQRKPDSLSGGEKFQVSMALALGLSDVVQNRAGGRKIDSMYIDEGFGTLDEAILSKAIEVLNTMAGDTRQIGIISHVDRLEESISQKIIVEKGDMGSTLRIVK